jgi:HSP20 family protein
MSALTLSRRNLLPLWASDLFDTGSFVGPGMLDLDGEFPIGDLAVRIPTVNIIENGKDFKIEMAAPGMEKKDFHVSVENGMLTISSEKKEEMKEKKENFTRREFSYSSFSRSFRLPENCLPDKIDAKYENGILKLSLPKKEVTVSKSVKEIKVS